MQSTKPISLLAVVAIICVVAYLVLGGGHEEQPRPQGSPPSSNGPAFKGVNADAQIARAEPPIDSRAHTPEHIGLVDPPAGVNDPNDLRPPVASLTPWRIASRLPPVGDIRLGMTADEVRALWPGAQTVRSADGKISTLRIETPDLSGIARLLAYVQLEAPHRVRAIRFVLEAPLRGLHTFDALIRGPDLQRGPLEYFDETYHIRALWQGPNWMSTLAVHRQTGELEWSFEHMPERSGDHVSQ